MEISEGTAVDGKYLVGLACNVSGGMGALVHVKLLQGNSTYPLVMKYCKDQDPENIQRFKREVRLLQEFVGNTKIVEILAAGLEHEPPYYVMRYYSQGDLLSLVPRIRSDLAFQESVFYRMLDCIDELHSKNTFHRDIKPQNFLVDAERIVVSDLGLSTELDSSTAFTKSSKFWGTPGYLPPEFHNKGGFKNAGVASDVFMLGKTFYVLLSGRDPMYLVEDDIHGAIFAVIDRCCALSSDARYSSLASLRQSLRAAYDILLERVIGPKKAGQLLRAISDRLKSQSKFVTSEVREFVEQLAMLELGDQLQICSDIPATLFKVLAQEPFRHEVGPFLAVYRLFVEAGQYGFGFAETIADNLQPLVESSSLAHTDRAFALKLAIHAAARMNRFAAMDTCRLIIRNISDENLGMRVREILLEYKDSFVANVEPVGCRSAAVRNALQEIRDQVRSEPF